MGLMVIVISDVQFQKNYSEINFLKGIFQFSLNLAFDHRRQLASRPENGKIVFENVVKPAGQSTDNPFGLADAPVISQPKTSGTAI